jgi:hypothetical protein
LAKNNSDIPVFILVLLIYGQQLIDTTLVQKNWMFENFKTLPQVKN